MKSFGKKLTGLSVLILGALPALADTHITQPEPDYDDFYATVGTVLAISVVIMLARRAKGFFR